MNAAGPQILRAADRVATRWKNGLGVTREIAAYPPGSDLDSFGWRVSMASVDTGGPFSSFPGVDRQLAVLEGRLALGVGGEVVEHGSDKKSRRVVGVHVHCPFGGELWCNTCR